MTTEHHPGPGWPFWAPADTEAIERALDLAELGPGDRFVDLGCGDGRVLVAAARRGARLVTVDFAVPGLIADHADGPAHVYRAPARKVRRRTRTGWPSVGGLVVAVPDYESLTCLEVIHPGGPVTVGATGSLADVATVRAGRDHADPGDLVAIDVRWAEEEADVVADGAIVVTGLPEFPMFVLFADDDIGLWELSAEGCERLARAFARGGVPATAAGLVAVATGEDDSFCEDFSV